MSLETDVMPDDVYTALGGIDAGEIPVETVEQVITFAEFEIGQRADSEGVVLTSEEAHHAVLYTAAHGAWTTSPSEVRRSALDSTTEWNVDSYESELVDRKVTAVRAAGIGVLHGGDAIC